MKWRNVIYEQMKFSQKVDECVENLLICLGYQKHAIIEGSQTRWFAIEFLSAFETNLWQNILS